MITPRLVEMGSQMTVKCAFKSVGGDKVFTGLSNKRAVRQVALGVGTEIWAKYSPYLEKVNVKVSKHTGCLFFCRIYYR